jgi:peptidoglycan hydrolase-like protein with peptidoglycan-binding domain
MKTVLLGFTIVCAVSFAYADPTTQSLQQTLKEQGFYYGAVTGDKSAETTAAIRRYQIRNGLQVTGELNEETSRAINSSSKYVASASAPTSKIPNTQGNNVRPNASSRSNQNAAPPSFSSPDHSLQTTPSYATSFYQSTPVQVNRRIIAEAQYRLMSQGYYRGRVDGKYGRQMQFALRSFQSRSGLATTGRLDEETLAALGSSGANFADSPSASSGYQTWMPVRKLKNGRWKMKWKRYYRPFNDERAVEDRQANSQDDLSSYNDDY